MEENELHNVVVADKHLLSNIDIVFILDTEIDTVRAIHVGTSIFSSHERIDHFVPSGDQARGELG